MNDIEIELIIVFAGTELSLLILFMLASIHLDSAKDEIIKAIKEKGNKL